MVPDRVVQLKAVAGSRGSLGDACVADKSQHFGSNGSSKQRGAGQMLEHSVGAFDRKPLRTVQLGHEPHAVSSIELPVDVATVVGCKPDAVERGDRTDADSCSLEFPGGSDWLVSASAAARASSPSPSRSTSSVECAAWRWSCLRWACEVA